MFEVMDISSRDRSGMSTGDSGDLCIGIMVALAVVFSLHNDLCKIPRSGTVEGKYAFVEPQSK